MMGELRQKVHAASRANMAAWKRANQERRAAEDRNTPSRIGRIDGQDHCDWCFDGRDGGDYGAVLRSFPSDMPGVVVVQHMPAGYTERFAARLNGLCAMQVKEAEAGDRIQGRGRVILAQGNQHLQVVREGGVYRVEFGGEEKVCGHRPSVEVLFESVAKEVGVNAVGVILTGMGNDGAGGMLAMRNAGGTYTGPG